MLKNLILVVDDDLKNLKLTCELLQVSGYNLISAIDGQQAVQTANNSQPDLILMDIHLPLMGGLEATRILKSDPATRHIKIVALTASAMQGDKEKAFEAGCDGYISKPIKIHEFMAEIEKYLSIKKEEKI